MAKAHTTADDELDSVLDDCASIKTILENAYTPESSREDLAAAVGEALDILEDYEDEEDDSENDNDDDLD